MFYFLKIVCEAFKLAVTSSSNSPDTCFILHHTAFAFMFPFLKSKYHCIKKRGMHEKKKSTEINIKQINAYSTLI